jgi:hypothetical protein
MSDSTTKSECPSCQSWRNGAMKVLDELRAIDGGADKAPYLRVRSIGVELAELREALRSMVNAFHGDVYNQGQHFALEKANHILNSK